MDAGDLRRGLADFFGRAEPISLSVYAYLTEKRALATNRGDGNREPSPFFYLYEGCGFDAGDLKGAAAALVFASGFIVEKHDIAEGLEKLGTITIIGIAGKAISFLAQEPAQIIGIDGSAEWAI